MRSKVFLSSFFLYTALFSQYTGAGGQHRVIFSDPDCGAELTIGSTYKIEWLSSFTTEYPRGTEKSISTDDKVGLYVFTGAVFSAGGSAGYSGPYCADPTQWVTENGVGSGTGNPTYHTSDGHVGTIKSDSEIDNSETALLPNSGEFDWTIPSSLNANTTYYLVIKFFNSDGGAKSYWLHNITIVIKEDTTPPMLTSVSSTVDNGTYGIGSVIPIIVTFDEPVIVVGTPSIKLETGAIDAVVNYSSGSGSSIITFNYIVDFGHVSDDLNYTDYDRGINYNSGSIKDIAGNWISDQLPIIGDSKSLGVNKDIAIDGIVPGIASTTISDDNVYTTVTFSEGIYNTNRGTGGVEKEDFNITLNQNGGTTTAANIGSILNGSGQAPSGGETVFNFNLNLTGVPNGVERITITPKSASVYDKAGNDASTFNQENNSVLLIDNKPPQITFMDPIEFGHAEQIRRQSRWMNKNSRVFYTLSETVASVKMTFTRVGGSIDSNSPHVASADEFLNQGNNNVGIPVLVDSAVYNIRLEAFDQGGNVGTDSLSNITYDISAPLITDFFPSANTYMNNTKVSYTISEDAQMGDVNWRECQDANCFGAWPSAVVMNITGQNLKAGTHTDVDLKPELKEGKIYSLQVAFTDSAGNNRSIEVGGGSVRGVTYDYTAPTVKSMSPASNSFLPIYTYSKVKLAFSEPIVDYKLSITSKRGMANNYYYGLVNDSLIISLDAPLTSVDTLTVRLDSISDYAGNIGIPIVSSFMTTYLGDFNRDYKIDAQDLSSFVSRWPNVDIGPVVGTLPILTPAMDGITNLRDIGVFTRMWHWSHGASPSSKIFASFGEPISIEQSADKMVIPISEHAIAGEIVIEYLKSDIDFNLSNESPENRIILSSKSQASENFIINFGYLREEKRKELSVDLIQKTNTHSNFSLGYIYYDKNGLVIKSGIQNLKIKAVPLEFALHENYPNPFNPSTTFRFDLPEITDASIIIYNMLGQKIKTFDMPNTPAGYHSLTWDATNDLGAPVSAGVYLYQLQTKGFVKTKKMILLK